MDINTVLEIRKDIQALDVIYSEYMKKEHSYPFQNDGKAENAFYKIKKLIENKYGQSLVDLRHLMIEKDVKDFTISDNWQLIDEIRGYKIWQGIEKQTGKAVFQVTFINKPSIMTGYYYNLQSLLKLKNLN